MVAEVFQIPDSREDLARYSTLRDKAPRKVRYRGNISSSPGLATIEQLIAGRLIDPRPTPVSNSDRGPPARHWKDNLPAAIAVLRGEQKGPDVREEERRASEARHRHLQRMQGRSLSPFPPGS